VHHGLPEISFASYPKTGQYLAFLGRISPEKGVDQAIEIAKQSGVPLKIAAKIDRSDAEYFESRIKPLLDNSIVEFIGEIGALEKNEFLGNASALLFPINWQEPFGLVMIEALACGLPVIAYPFGSVPEIIEDGVIGFLVHDVAEAVQAVRRISTIDRRICRQVFQKRFTSKRMARDYVAIYERMIAREPKPLALEEDDITWTKLESRSNTT
jgi:glycosyltransferase involved in cell wall biosynthesis